MDDWTSAVESLEGLNNYMIRGGMEYSGNIRIL